MSFTASDLEGKNDRHKRGRCWVVGDWASGSARRAAAAPRPIADTETGAEE